MSGFENYRQELADLDREILHFAAVCGVAVDNRAAVERCLADPHESWAEDKARQSLRGLLVLRIKVETEMIEEGFDPASIPPVGATPAH